MTNQEDNAGKTITDVKKYSEIMSENEDPSTVAYLMYVGNIATGRKTVTLKPPQDTNLEVDELIRRKDHKDEVKEVYEDFEKSIRNKMDELQGNYDDRVKLEEKKREYSKMVDLLEEVREGRLGDVDE